jgi:hypothetical protein
MASVGQTVAPGISLKQLQTFVKEHHDRIQGKTTAEIIPLVKAVSGLQSYVDLVSQACGGSDKVGSATCFVVHTGKGQFVDLISALEHKYPAGNQYFWIDIFCLELRLDFAGQDAFRLLDATDRLLPTLPEAILILTTPVEGSMLLTRSWCLYELVLALDHGLRIDAALPTNDFVDTAAAAAAVDVATAGATRPADAAAILERIAHRPGGAEAFNRRARNCLCACLATAAATTTHPLVPPLRAADSPPAGSCVQPGRPFRLAAGAQPSSEGEARIDPGAAAGAPAVTGKPLVQVPTASPAGEGGADSSRRAGKVRPGPSEGATLLKRAAARYGTAGEGRPAGLTSPDCRAVGPTRTESRRTRSPLFRAAAAAGGRGTLRSR